MGISAGRGHALGATPLASGPCNWSLGTIKVVLEMVASRRVHSPLTALASIYQVALKIHLGTSRHLGAILHSRILSIMAVVGLTKLKYMASVHDNEDADVDHSTPTGSSLAAA